MRLASLLIVILIGIAVRCPYLSERSIWFDEASSWRTASFPVADMLQSIRENVHAPLYYFLLKCWMSIFGDSPAALRSLSVLFGAATILGMYLFGREVYAAVGFEKRTCATQSVAALPSRSERGNEEQHWFALLVAGLVALSPFQIDASIETKMYALGTALTALSSWLLLRALRADRSSPWWEFYALSVLTFLYTHHFALLSIAGQMLFLGIWLGWRAWRDSLAEIVFLARRLALPALLVAVAYLPWFLVLKEQTARVQRDYWVQALSWEMVQTTLGSFVLPAPEFWSVAELRGIVLGSLAVLAAALWRPRAGNLLVFFSATMPLLLAAVISWGITPIWYPRYFRFVQLFFLAAVAIAVWRISLAWLRTWAACVVIAGLSGLIFDYWSGRDIANRPGMRGVMERIYAETDGEPAIVVIRPMHYFPAHYYARGSADIRLLSRGKPVPHFHGGPIVLPGDLISTEELKAYLAKGVWIISPSSVADEVAGMEACEVSRSFQVAYDRPIHSPIWVDFYRKAKAQ